MYKSIIKQMIPSVSEEEALGALKKSIQSLSIKYPHCTEEELEKGIRHAFTKGVSVLSLIAGLHSMSPKDDIKEKPQMSQSRQIESSTSFKDKKTGSFLKTMALGNTSGNGKYNMRNDVTRSGLDALGENHPLNRKYKGVSDDKLSASVSANPDHEHEVATAAANYMTKKFGGDDSKSAYSWRVGSGLTNDHFAGDHKDYKSHESVQDFQQNRGKSEMGVTKPSL